MDARTRAIIRQFYMDDYTEEGIASALQLSQRAVRAVLIDLQLERRQNARKKSTEQKLLQKKQRELRRQLATLKVDKETKLKIFELRAEGFSTSEIAITLKVPELAVEHTFEKDRLKIKKNERALECLSLYKDGLSLEEIGEKFNITRERVRQIMVKQFAFSLGYGPLEQKARKVEIKKQYRTLVEDARIERRHDVVRQRYDEALSKGLEPNYFDSFVKYADATGISPEALKEHIPDAYQLIQKNAKQKSKRWSWYYDACRVCGTTTIKYRSNGYCEQCYSRSPEFKMAQQRSHQKNRDTILAQNKKYYKEYYNRPEIMEKIEREYDERHFGGNRKAALERDGYKCLGCGMSTDVKDKTGRSKVRVWHLNNKDDHSLDNLRTYCQSCLFKDTGLSSWNKYGRSGQV